MNRLPPELFDDYSGDYETALQKGLSLSGENRDYFARGRIECLAERLAEHGMRPKAVVDFGCGLGGAAPLLMEHLAPETVLGVDVSVKSLEIARSRYGSDKIVFEAVNSYSARGNVDVFHCNGVFHHIPAPEQETAMRLIYDSLRPGGFFAFFENNPWNPGARVVMSRIPFDRDAVMISPRQARRLAAAAGFEVIVIDYLFFFPRILRKLRFAEKHLKGVPLGAQYLVLCRKLAD